jgi:type IV pilus assembly protein PilW
MSGSLTTRARAAGFSLVELLVAMAIGLIVTLAIGGVLIISEGTKRTTGAVNDIDQTGAYVAYMLDRTIRSAGTGYSQNWSSTYGCLLDAKKSGTQVLPLSQAIPTGSAFANVTTTVMPFRLAPVIIGKNLANSTSPSETRGDVLMVMGGTAGAGEIAQAVSPGSVTSTSLLTTNALGIGTNDMVLLADPKVTAGCMIQEVGTRTRTASGQSVPLAGTYYTSSGTNVSLANFVSDTTVIAQLGNEPDNLPQFQLYGVGSNQTLFSMDLLNPPASGTLPDIPVADGVVEMRALYGIDTTSPPDGVVDQWVDPGTTGYTAASLLDGSAAAQVRLRGIVAVRVGFILRTWLQEKAPVMGPVDPNTGLGTASLALTLFSSLGSSLTYTRTYAAQTLDLNYRYRTVEFTVPLRNVLLAPQS